MKAIMDREFDSYFNSMLGYVFLAMFLLLTGVGFTITNLLGLSSDMTGFFSSFLIIIATFILPVLTMRLFSEDKKLKTDQLLITSPISISEMVLGKFFAAFSVFLTGTLITLIYPIVINFFGTLPVAETISCYVGFILLGATIISIGTFMSSLTESQVIAAISTIGILIIVYILGSLSSNMSNVVIATALKWISPFQRFIDFEKGILDLESIIYYVSITGLFIFLTTVVFEKRRFK